MSLYSHGTANLLLAAHWLLVFDNVVSVKSIRPFWPHSTHGAIIVTSQKQDFTGFTTAQTKVEPMSAEEGSALFLRYLRLNEGEQADVEALSSELGGLPLAITHYAGYIAVSRISIPEVLASFQRRQLTAEVWSCHSNASLLQYEKSLDTVWDFALREIPSDSRNLLDILSLLHADSIPETMLLADHSVLLLRSGLTKAFR
jgi:hypothetical protein